MDDKNKNKTNPYAIPLDDLREQLVQFLISNKLSIVKMGKLSNITHTTIEDFIRGDHDPRLLTKIKLILSMR